MPRKPIVETFPIGNILNAVAVANAASLTIPTIIDGSDSDQVYVQVQCACPAASAGVLNILSRRVFGIPVNGLPLIANADNGSLTTGADTLQAARVLTAVASTTVINSFTLPPGYWQIRIGNTDAAQTYTVTVTTQLLKISSA